MAATLVLDGCAIATVDGAGTEYQRGHLVLRDGVIAAVGAGPAPRPADPAASAGAEVSVLDASGCLATPGLVNTHHHLYQWATRGLAADSGLFDWLRTLYPIWAHLDAGIVAAAATVGLARLALTGCTTTTDHHYIFPAGGGLRAGDDGPPAGDLLGATIDSAVAVGLRFHPGRGSMDLGASAGGLPPDSVVEDLDTALAATEEAIARHHDPSPAAMVRIAVAPCSPFSVSPRLLASSAELARRLGVRMHTHLAETADEDEYCRATYGRLPVDHLDALGWLGPDVWLAHCVHLPPPAVARLAATGTGVAHCPSSNGRLGSGAAPVRELLDAGVPVGLGVDGAASGEAGSLVGEVQQALYVARTRRGPTGLSAREALRAATADGARCLGREDEIGSLEAGKRADVALWRMDGPWHADIADPVTAFVLGPPAPLALLLVEGREVVRDGVLRTVSIADAGRDLVAARRRLLASAGGAGKSDTASAPAAGQVGR